MFKKIQKKTASTVAAEWDALAPVRFRQITSGDDVTFKHILAPAILKLAQKEHAMTIVDAGCGIGALTHLLRNSAGSIIGVDPSRESILIAQHHYQSDRVNFRQGSLELFARKAHSTADVLIANMVLMDVIELNSFVRAASLVLRPGGAMIFSITHPWFWPMYYGYANEPWFKYEKETIIESPFRISNFPTGELASTHVHRPLARYIEAFHEAALQIEHLQEPMPRPPIMKLYPKKWKHPRYLLGVCRKLPNL